MPIISLLLLLFTGAVSQENPPAVSTLECLHLENPCAYTSLIHPLNGGTGNLHHPRPYNELHVPHPSYTLTTPFGAERSFMVGGLDMLPDGRIALVTMQENDGVYFEKNSGNLYLITESGNDYSIDTLDTGLNTALGLKVVNETIYVMDAFAIYKYTPDLGGNYSRQMILELGFNGGGFGQQPMGFEIRDGIFYYTVSSIAVAFKFDPTVDTEGVEISGGMRFPNAMVLGIDDELFAFSAQGENVPTNQFNQVKEGAVYSHHAGNDAAPSSIRIPVGEAGNAPSQPILIPEGVFKDQLILGDTRHPNMHRIYMEKIGEGYQGGLIHFGGGTMGGINRIARDGNDFFIGAVGLTGYHFSHHLNGTSHGFQKLTFGGNHTFELLRADSRQNGFLLTYTSPLDEATAVPENFFVSSWKYAMASTYGGIKEEVDTLAVEKVDLTSDKTKAFLTIPGLQDGRLVYISTPDIRSETGAEPWAFKTWYTLNEIGPELSPDEFVHTEPSFSVAEGISIQTLGKKIVVYLNQAQKINLKVTDIRGKNLARKIIHKTRKYAWDLNHLTSGITILHISGQKFKTHHMFVIP